MKQFARKLFLYATALSCGACWPDASPIDGTCSIEPRSALDCRVAGPDGDVQAVGLVGYSCTGSARPDLDATVSEGVPDGILCADKGPLRGSGDQSYCCTEDYTPCAYDPQMECPDAMAGYQCWGNDRPESLNPSIRCSNGNLEQGLITYCCTGRPEPSPCQESSVAGCGDRLKGFLCKGHGLPRGEDLGSNQSRADYYYATCSTPRTAPNPEYQTYCCYMPSLVPIGGSCVNHTAVPGCAPGRFGFACYGPDTPEDDFPPMKCPDPPESGRSAEGYEAKLYCCDFE
jgi:hypothetical protein